MSPDYFPLELQIGTLARQRFALDDALLLPPAGRRLFHLRLLGERLRRELAAASAGELQLLALLNRALRRVAEHYLQARHCELRRDELILATTPRSVAQLAETETAFVACYPPAPGWPAVIGSPEQYRTIVVELCLLATQTQNPAAAPLTPLFDPSELSNRLDWRRVLHTLEQALQPGPATGPLLERPLLALLLEPILAAPDSLAGQLRYVRSAWQELLPAEFLDEILVAFDLVAEEHAERHGGPGETALPGLGGESEPERFSPDTEWMPNVVLLAKTIYVWLHQLSRQYGYPIERLDQIPEAEIELLVQRGFTSLWLIGIWERSPASAQIKQRMGNSEAVASAYSLFDYVVAADLGGEAALATLRQRCHGRGLRLACDVVPNHTGLDSRWVREHPDWYVQVDHPPYPAYRFNGPNLSSCEGTELYIEDGYWNHGDAAVVFKHVQHGRVRYLYHGNDGTHLPWNDTAQLNFLLPQVREAMIGTIVHVARSFPVIRFDAAMTLAKKHFQRLWFPQPGGGAGVPSRAEHAMSRASFDEVFPQEFWREVVDRVAVEAPDTLLLAEAFWLMEGYFVRTLGMHRVYNSAFMNMLKNEENAKYRTVLKNILEFEPEILKRFVNFMNNPDEETAVAQFGKTDKYFGTAVLLATLPGLPMFGHGQIEGFSEKYGMEYRRAYRDEMPDEGFIAHHQTQIFPLLLRRPLFSGAQAFVLYDFLGDAGVNEDVYAYSNSQHNERALVVVHNRHASSNGWVRQAVPKRVRDAAGERLEAPTLGAALNLGSAELWRFRDQHSGLEFLRRGAELVRDGLHLLLGPYDYHVFLDWRPLNDDGTWGRLCDRLAGAPCADLDQQWQALQPQPLPVLAQRTPGERFLPRWRRGAGNLLRIRLHSRLRLPGPAPSAP